MGQWEGRGSRHERGYGAAWVKLRARILKRDKYLCQPCLRMARVTAATEVDHIKPKAGGSPYAARMPGGIDDPSNLQSICNSCHKAKTVKDAGGQIKVRHRIGHDGWPIEERES